MRPIGDPDYCYRPWPAERRAAASRRERSRRGIPEDCCQIYGVHVPNEYADRIREGATTIARKKDYAAAQRFVERAKKNGWRIRRDTWSAADLEELRKRWVAGQTGLQIGKALGRSRSAVLGKINRMGFRRAPAGHSEIHADMIRPMIAATLGEGEPDDQSPTFRTALLLVAPMFVAWTPGEMTRWTGYRHSEAEQVIRTMTTNGIWKGGKPDLNRYMQGEGKPGFQMGDMSLVLDTLLCLGQVRCEYGGERWYNG